MGMRVLVSSSDQLRRTTPDQLPAYCDAVLRQFQEIASATNAWADEDHDDTGVHLVMHIKQSAMTPDALPGHLVIYWDGTNLKYVKPDGATGNIV